MTLQVQVSGAPSPMTDAEKTDVLTTLGAASAASLAAHAGNASNPHGVTKSQVGLGSVDNTADADKPVSQAQAVAIAAAVAAHEAAADPHQQYLTQAEGDARYAAVGAVGVTNLSATASPTGLTVVSDTGTDATLPLADATNAGLMAPEQVTKLAGVAAGATANATDAQLRDRSTHTGSQAIDTVTGLQAELDGKATAAQGTKADTAIQPSDQLTQAAVTAATAAGVALLDAADAAAQRSALGLGTAATQASTAFATAAQGAAAATALQPGVLPVGTTLAAAQVSDAGTAGRSLLRTETLAEIQALVSEGGAIAAALAAKYPGLSMSGLQLLTLGYDSVTPATQYSYAYRAAQPTNGNLVDQSGRMNDSSLPNSLIPQSWAASTVYSVGNYRSPLVPNGNLYKCTTAGTSGSTQPAWPTTIGATVSDGSCVWTCEKGPWYIDSTTGRRQFRSIRSSQLGTNGAWVLPAIDWDLAAGDSLIISLSGAFDFTGQGDEVIFAGNCPTGGPNVRGFYISAGQSFNDFRINIAGSGGSIITGHGSNSFARKPLNNGFQTTTYLIDGQSKRMYAYASGVAIQQVNMYNMFETCPNDLSLASIGSTLQTDNVVFGGSMGSTHYPNSSSCEIGMQRFDVLVLKNRGLPADITRIAQWFHQRGELPLPMSYLY